jgi:hypothetical protein
MVKFSKLSAVTGMRSGIPLTNYLLSSPPDQYAPSEDSSELYSKYISAQSDLSHLRSSRALLYILLDALGESEFQKFAENIDLDISTRHLVTDCWAIDHLKIDVSMSKSSAVE